VKNEGADPFSYNGKLSVVIQYRQGEFTPDSLRDVFDGIYPRFDRRHDRERRLSSRAAFESLPIQAPQDRAPRRRDRG
jgi:hypothetical protein